MQANPSHLYDFSEFQKHEEDPPAVESCDQSSSTCPPTEEVSAKEESKSGMVYIKTLGDQIFPIAADLSDLVKTIREKVQKKIKVPLKEMNLLYASVPLQDDKSLSHYRISDKATIHLLLGDKDPNQITLECYTQLGEGQCEISLLYEQQTFPLKIQVANRIVKDLKGLVSNKVLRSDKEFVLLYNGKLLLEEEKALTEYGIEDQSTIIVIPTPDGGDCLKFTQLMLKTVIKDLAHLKSSLDFLQTKAKIENFVMKAQYNLKNIKMTTFELNNASEEGLLSIMMWTSDILYRKLNEDLRGDGNFSQWNVYLKNFFNGLKFMPLFKGTVYRGFRNYKDLSTYQKGKFVTWKTVSALSKNPKTAKETFSNSSGTIFEVEVFSARDISSISLYKSEEEVIMLPYSYFQVVDVIEAPGMPVYVKLKEFSASRARKRIENLNGKSLSCVFCPSTKNTLNMIENYRWLLYFESAKSKVITDMVRDETGVVKYSSGLAIVERLVRDRKENFEILICHDDV